MGASSDPWEGQIGSNWSAEPYQNLLMSAILQPKFLFATQQFVLNIIASLAVSDTLKEYGLSVKIKWPNDIYIEHKKVCGILVQNVLQGKFIKYSILGIGLNVNQKIFDASLPNPTSMGIVMNKEFDIAQIKSSLCKYIQYYYTLLIEEGYDAMKKLYIEQLYRRDVEAIYLIDDEQHKGIIRDVKDSGHLQLELYGTLRDFSLRELKYVIT